MVYNMTYEVRKPKSALLLYVYFTFASRRARVLFQWLALLFGILRCTRFRSLINFLATVFGNLRYTCFPSLHWPCFSETLDTRVID